MENGAVDEGLLDAGVLDVGEEVMFDSDGATESGTKKNGELVIGAGDALVKGA